MIKKILLIVSMLLPATAFSMPMSYKMVFEVQEKIYTRPVPNYQTACLSPVLATGAFECNSIIAVGSLHFGSFSVDATGLLSAFRIQIGSIIWDLLDPNSQLSAFRNPSQGLGAPDPGFVLKNGLITGFSGGVSGKADVPFIDWKSATGSANKFSAFDLPGVNLKGDFRIHKIPEPNIMFLFLFSIILIFKKNTFSLPQPAEQEPGYQ